jgi:hypothetical protein
MNSKIKLILDIVLTVVFVLLMDPHSIGGLDIHEWAGLAICFFFIVHKAFNWAWIKAVSASFFGKVPPRVRLNYILDILLLIGMVAIVLSGMKISKTIDFSWLPEFGSGLFWRFLHLSGSVLTLAVVGIHVGLHWKWVLSTVSVGTKKRSRV